MENEIYISVVLPIYNEEKLLKNTLFDVDNYLKKQTFTYEIVAVDDGSMDGTAEILKNLLSEIKSLKIISNDCNRGKGYSVRRGILASKGNLRLFMDADNSTRITEIGKFINVIKNGADAAIGDRTLSESFIVVHQPTYKKIFGNLGNILIRAFAVPGIRDTQCGFKCFAKDFVEGIFPLLEIDRWAFDVEILALAKKRGYKIQVIPVVWKNRKESKVKIGDYFKTLLDLVKIKINLLTNKYERAK